MNCNAYPPVIIIGMHRSGTGMITHTLEQLGLFMGKHKQRNQEAQFFLDLNVWLLRQCGGAWDHPEPIQYLLINAKVRALVVDYLRQMLKTPQVIRYLGWANYLRYRNPLNFDVPWGWKDPRSTFTLPLWLDVFPEAKVVHVYRNGLDVSESLRTRMQKLLLRGKWGHEKLGKRLRAYWFYARRAGFTDSLRCAASLEESFSLWESYMREARAQVQHLADHAIEIKYEQFVAEPRSGLMQLAQFCGLHATEAAIDQLAGSVDKPRAYAYRNNPELLAFANKVSARLAEWGY